MFLVFELQVNKVATVGRTHQLVKNNEAKEKTYDRIKVPMIRLIRGRL